MIATLTTNRNSQKENTHTHTHTLVHMVGKVNIEESLQESPKRMSLKTSSPFRGNTPSIVTYWNLWFAYATTPFGITTAKAKTCVFCLHNGLGKHNIQHP